MGKFFEEFIERRNLDLYRANFAWRELRALDLCFVFCRIKQRCKLLFLMDVRIALVDWIHFRLVRLYLMLLEKDRGSKVEELQVRHFAKLLS